MGNIGVPEASLLLGRGHMPRKKDGKNQNSQYAPSVASSSDRSRISTASFVNGGDSPSSVHHNSLTAARKVSLGSSPMSPCTANQYQAEIFNKWSKKDRSRGSYRARRVEHAR